MKNNNKQNNSVPISPAAPPDSSVPAKRSPEPTVPEKVAAKYYPNSNTSKAQILSDNKNKSGVYKWKNKINDKCYIGSSENLSCRLPFYYSNSSMESLLKRSKSHICSALLKHGLSNFSLEIIEYCEPSKCLEREGYYQKKWNPEYNIAKEPGASMSGRKHSDKSKQIMSDAKKDKPKVEGSGRPSQQIEVVDLQEKTSTYYNSISEAARALNIHKSVIGYYFSRNQTNPYKDKYIFNKIVS